MKKDIEPLEIWRKIYCYIIPIIIVVLYAVICYVYKIKVYESEFFSDTLSAIITFVSIIISFFGVLLTILISAKEKSEVINYFLDSIDRDDFISSIKKLIACGLMTVVFSSVLFLNDVLSYKFITWLLLITIYMLIRFTTLTYRFTNILLMLFIRDKMDYTKRKCKNASEEVKQEVKELLKSNDKQK